MGQDMTRQAEPRRLLGVDGEFSQAEASFLEAWDAAGGDMAEVRRRVPPAIVNIGGRSKRVWLAIRHLTKGRFYAEMATLAVDTYVAGLKARPGTDDPMPTALQVKIAKDVFDRLGIIPPKAQAEVDGNSSKNRREKTVDELNREIAELEDIRRARQLQAKVIEATAEPVAQA